MTILDEKYTPEKRCDAIINHGSGTLVALAGPGTGKTSALRKRVRALTVNRGVDADSIVYVTFIREITREFEEALRREFKDEAHVPNVAVSTLHALAFGLLRNMGKVIGRTGQHEPLNIDSDKDLAASQLQEDICSVLGDAGRGIGPTALRSYLGEVKANWQNGVDEPQLSNAAQMALNEYERLAGVYDILDWDQVVLCANQICDRLEALPEWLGRIQHFLVDEYQDFNPAEQAFLDRIVAGRDSVVIVGDDDQSLYGWRGAQPSGIVRLSLDDRLDHVSLVHSWRCPSGILTHTNRFLRWMRESPRNLEASGAGGSIEARHFKSAKEEGAWLAARLQELLDTIAEGADPEEGIACLFPSNAVLSCYKSILDERGIHCTIPRMSHTVGARQWARILLRLAHLRRQPLLERVLLRKFPAITAGQDKAVLDTFLSVQCTLAEAVASCARVGAWPQDAADCAHAYCQFLKSLTSSDPSTVSECIQGMLGDWVHCAPERVECFFEEAHIGLEDAVTRFVDEIFDPDKSTTDDVPGYSVELYTIHGAKGLTRRYVLLPGCEELWMPSAAASADPDEQKRLFYVAVTRAKELVIITAPRSRARQDPLCRGKVFDRRMSPFVPKLGLAIRRMN